LSISSIRIFSIRLLILYRLISICLISIDILLFNHSIFTLYKTGDNAVGTGKLYLISEMFQDCK